MPFKKGVTPPGAKPFVKGQSGNPKGQPKKLLTVINDQLKAEGYLPVKNSHVIDAYNTLLNLPENKIKEIITDTTTPMFLRIVAKAMLSPKGVEMIEKILDRAHGKAKQNVGFTDSEGKDVRPQFIFQPAPNCKPIEEDTNIDPV